MKTKKSKGTILLFVLIVSLFQRHMAYGSDKAEKETYFKKATSFSEQQKWDEAIWYYKKYLLGKEKNSTYYDTLYKIANIYYEELQKYYYALEMYKELPEKFNGERKQVIEERIKNLERNIDGDLFNYAIEHDLNLSDDKKLSEEINEFLPQNIEIIYKYTRGFDGTIKIFKIFYSREKTIKILDNNENEMGIVALEEFARLWAGLMLIEWYDVPEENAIVTSSEDRIFAIAPSYLACDVSNVEIIIFEDGKQRKIIHISALELASDELKKIDNYFQEMLNLIEEK